MKNGNNAKVLLACDDQDIGQYWTHWLGLRSIEVTQVTSGGEALVEWSNYARDLIIVDFYQRLSDEIRTCRQLRSEVANPLLLYTYRSQDPEILELYQAGADDCLIKPLSNFVLLAKVQAWLRHSWSVPASALEPIQVGDFRLEPGQRRVVKSDESIVNLTNLELRLLYVLMLRHGQPLEADLIRARVWGDAAQGDGGPLKNLVYRLRRKLESDPRWPRYIQTVGDGYMFRSS